MSASDLKILESVKIRDAHAGDLAEISQIYNYFVSRSTATFAMQEETLAERQQWFEQHQKAGLPVLVATGEDGRILAWASLSFYHERCGYRQTVEPSLYVHHEFHSKGLGRKMTTDLMNRAEEGDFHCMVALVCSENETSIKVLRSFGFEEKGVLRQVGRKFDRWLDVTMLQKMLGEVT